MATTNYTSLLGLALPTQGDLSGTWGDEVNNAITSLLDGAVAGTTTLATDANVTLTTSNGAANQARQMILLCTGARTAERTITAPAKSKLYIIQNNTTGGFAVKLVGAGPTTGVSIAAGTTAAVAWNGTDFAVIGVTTTGVQTLSNKTLTAPAVSGNLAFTGTGNRITGDFSNATVANRVMFQTSTVNGNTRAGVVPNGTGTISALDLHSTADPTNTSRMGIAVVGASDTRIVSDALGSGTVLPMTFWTGGAERTRIDTSGNVGIGTGAPGSKLDVVGTSATDIFHVSNSTSYFTVGVVAATSVSLNAYQGGIGPLTLNIQSTGGLTTFGGSALVTAPSGLGYGTGAGGTVTQATSKSTSVTLNKPTGQITMNAAALAAGATVGFSLTNSVLGAFDVIIINITNASGVNVLNYRAEAHILAAGTGYIKITNISAGSLSEAVGLNFAIIKGSVS